MTSKEALKDLEVLEIIKRKFLVTTNFVSFIIYNNDEEYNKIVQWIINDANKNKSINGKQMLNSLYGIMLNTKYSVDDEIEIKK